MFGRKFSVQIPVRFCQKGATAFLLFSFLTASFTASADAASGKPRRAARPAAKSIVNADIRLAEVAAHRTAGKVRIAWRTNYEENNLGFRVWREEAGQRELVKEEMIAGSLLKVSNGVLPAGEEYNLTDRSDSLTAVYWLEAVDVNAKSRWYGPVAPQTTGEELTATADSTTVAELNETTAGRREQLDRVELPKSTKGFAKTFAAAAQAVVSPQAAAVVTDPNALKIEVRNRGMYRVSTASLAELGDNAAVTGGWRLYAGGVEQPLIVNQDGSLEFFGSPIETLQTDANVYWLVPDTTGGQTINRVTQNYLPSAIDSFYMVTAERKDKVMRVSSVINGARENWFGAVVNPTGVNQTLTLTDIATDSGTNATLAVDLQGLTNYAHQVAVTVNGIAVGQINFNFYDRTEWTASLPLGYLVEGANTVNLRAIGGSSDVNITESVRIVYPRRLKAQNNRLEFSLAGNRSVKLRNFTSPAVRVFDVTNPAQVIEYAPESRQETDGTYTVTVAASSTPRVMLAQGDNSAMRTATPLIRNEPSILRSTQNQGRLVVITPREFAKAFWELRDLRNWEGMPTQIVNVEDIYDEFNFGIPSAEAIKAFLQYARQNWTIKPDYVIFGGDGSIDPKNYSGQGGTVYNRVPTMFVDTWNMETVSDEMMVDFDGDDVGEISHGRFPANTIEQLDAMVQRAIAFSPMSGSELNRRGVHFVSDSLIGYDFAAGSRNAAGTIPGNVSINYLDRTTQDAGALRQDILNRINSGAAIVNYFGHAAVGSWTGAQILRSTDAASLVNQKRQPLMVMLACLNGDYAEAGIEGLAEALMKPTSGGALAIWAASGWNTAQAQEYMAREFYQRVFTGMRVGDAARQAKATTLFTDQKRTYVFFGDPTMRLVAP